MSSQRRRVVITGTGLLSSLGVGVEQSWKNVLAGKSGLARIPEKPYYTPQQKEHLVGGYLPSEAFTDEFRQKNQIRMQDDAYFQVNSMIKEAVKQAKLYRKGTIDNSVLSDADREQFAIIFGIFQCNPSGQSGTANQRGAGLIKYTPFAMVGAMALQYQIVGFSAALLNGCLKPIGDAYRLIKDGYQDRAVVGGFDLNTDSYLHMGFVGSGIYCTPTADAHDSYKPFDVKATGCALGDGGGIILLEDLESALARKANILAEITGYDSNTTFNFEDHLVPSESGSLSLLSSIVKQTGWKPEEVDLVSCTGMGTEASDRAEVAIVEKFLGGKGGSTHVNTLKSYTGHMTFGSGAAETALLVKALNEGVIPGTANLKEPISGKLNFVKQGQHVEKKNFEKVIKMEHGLGPYNEVLAIQKWKQ